jgi:hypothetical protein
VTDYDRACDVPGGAGVLDLKTRAGHALVLRGTTTACYLPDRRLFVQWVRRLRPHPQHPPARIDIIGP